MRALVITHSITRRDAKSIEKYLNEISKYPVMSPEEELRMFQQYKNGDQDAYFKIVNHNLRFVVSVAKQYQHTGLSLEDLINEGNLGLMKAARRFDETKGFKFISYAVWWVRQSILQAISEKSRKIRLPLNQQSVSSKVYQKQIELLQKMEREPSIEELAEATGFTPEIVKKCLKGKNMVQSLDAPVDEDGEASFSYFLEDKQTPTPDHEVSVHESQQIEVRQLLSSLDERESAVLSMFYGIGRKGAMSLDDIGYQLGISRERVRQIRDKSLRKLRKHQPSFSMN